MALLSIVIVAVAALLQRAAAHNEPAPLSLVNVSAVAASDRASATLTVTPDVIVPPAMVSVAWSVDSSLDCTETAVCWLGVYLVGEEANKTTPMEYVLLPSKEQSGAARFRLLNVRASFVFHLFRGGLKHPVLIGSSAAVAIAAAAEFSPHAGRLSLTHALDEMVVTWTSKELLPAGTPGVVEFGVSPGKYTQTTHAKPAPTPYARESMCGAPATTIGWRTPGAFYTAVLAGLLPSTRYYYRFGSNTAWSAEHSFLSRPPAASEVNLFAFGDLGEMPADGSDQWNGAMPPSQNTTTGMAADLADGKANFSLVLHNGDISYARGYASQWEVFHDQIEAVATSVPWMVSVGNHERDFVGSGSQVGSLDSGGECGVASELRFHPTMWARAPDGGSTAMPKGDEPWYAFDYGPLHIVMISTEHAFDATSAQYAFVEADLARVNRTTTPWILFAGHRPYYISSTNNDAPSGDQPVATALRASFEDLLHKHSTTTPVVQLGAHHHSYQRSCAAGVYNNACVKEGEGGGVVVVNLGMAGAGNSHNVQQPTPPIWEVVDDSHHGYTRIRANQTTFHLDYVRGGDREVFDSFTLTSRPL